MKTSYTAALVCVAFLQIGCTGSGGSAVPTPSDDRSLAVAPPGGVSLDIVTYGGAVPDDLEDDRAAIQRTIDAVHAAGGGTVTVPTGTFLLGTVPDASPIQVIALEIHSDLTLKGTGPGSILKLKDNNGNYDTLLGAKPSWEIVDNFSLRDLTIDANGSNNPISNELSSMEAMSQNGHRSSLRIYKGKDIEVTGCTFTDIKGVWVLVFNGYVERVKVSDNVFKNIGDASVDWDHSTIYTNGDDFTIANNRISSRHGAGTLGARAAIEIHGSNQKVSDNSIDGMTHGINVTGYSSLYHSINQVYFRNSFRNVMSGFVFWSETDGSEDRDVTLGLENVLIQDNVIELDPEGWTDFEHFNGGSGFMFEQNRNKDIDRVFIIDNRVTFKAPRRTDGKMTMNAAGLILPANNVPDVKVSNLYFLGNTVEDAYGPGVYVDAGVEDSVLAKNRFRNGGSSVPFIHDPFRSAVFLSGKLSNFQFVCNTVDDETGAQELRQLLANYSHNAGNCVAYGNISTIPGIPLLANSPESSGEPWNTNPDKPLLSFDADTVVLKPGSDGRLLTILLGKPFSTPVNVEIFVLDNTARLGRDFSVDRTTVTFLPGETTKPIRIRALRSPSETERDRTATLVLRSDAAVTTGCTPHARLVFQP